MISWLLNKFANWALSKNKPGSYQGEDDNRWAYVIETDGSPYLTRILSPRIFGYRVFLHHFHRPDIDQHLHNHPWKWAASLILNGSYTEERLEGVYGTQAITFTQKVKRFNLLRDTDYHKVLELHGDVWTLFLTGPRIQDWGFLVEGQHVPWTEYLMKKWSE